MTKAINKRDLQISLFDTDNCLKEDFYGFKQNENWFDNFGLHLRETVKFTRRPKIISLFSGAGGLDIGFFDAGFDIVEKVELEEKFVETLKCNSSDKGYYKSNSKVTCIDIAKYHPNHTEIDFIIGGPPCQSFSAAGARASGVSGTRDERGKLFHEYVRILKQVNEFSEELSFRKRKRELTNHYKAISENAIKLLNLKKSKISLLSYRANLDTNLSWVNSNNGSIKIDEIIEEGKLYILLNEVDTYPKNNSFKLKIAPTDQWSLPFHEVVIISDKYSDQLYTSAWKAFESFLSRNSLKADLVQLSGYYQYKCSFKCNLEIKHSNDIFINILLEITKGVEINKHLDKEYFERKYNIARNQIVLLLERFKKMGFEIRNHLTNPSISKGYFLIPYCFPTMNENSVQRTKSLLDKEVLKIVG